MTIDLLPTIAGLVGTSCQITRSMASIFGRSWPACRAQNPHDAYYHYYADNESSPISSGPLKLYLPHTYRTLAGQTGRNDGLPIKYQNVKMTEPELYDVDADIGEKHDLAAGHTGGCRAVAYDRGAGPRDLGDTLHQRAATGARPVGRLSEK